MIDWEQIKQLEEDVGAEDLAEVIVIFLEEVDEAVDKLRNQEALPPDELGPAMHFLKGSAYNLGFKGFGDYCSDGERLANDGKDEEVDLAKVVSLYDLSKTEFMAEAPNHCSFQP